MLHRVQHYLHDNPVCWPRCYIHCVRHPHGGTGFSITPNGIERTKLFGVSSIVRSVVGALPQVFVAAAAWLPYFKSHTPQAYLTSAAVSAIGIIFLTRLTFATQENAQSIGRTSLLCASVLGCCLKPSAFDAFLRQHLFCRVQNCGGRFPSILWRI